MFSLTKLFGTPSSARSANSKKGGMGKTIGMILMLVALWWLLSLIMPSVIPNPVRLVTGLASRAMTAVGLAKTSVKVMGQQDTVINNIGSVRSNEWTSTGDNSFLPSKVKYGSVGISTGSLVTTVGAGPLGSTTKGSNMALPAVSAFTNKAGSLA